MPSKSLMVLALSFYPMGHWDLLFLDPHTEAPKPCSPIFFSYPCRTFTVFLVLKWILKHNWDVKSPKHIILNLINFKYFKLQSTFWMECIFIYHHSFFKCLLYVHSWGISAWVNHLTLCMMSENKGRKRLLGHCLRKSLVMSKDQSIASYLLSFIVSCPLGLVKTPIGNNWAWIFKHGESRWVNFFSV